MAENQRSGIGGLAVGALVLIVLIAAAGAVSIALCCNSKPADDLYDDLNTNSYINCGFNLNYWC